MLRGDQVAPELRWRDEEGVHRSQARPRPSPREQIGAERFAGLVGSGQPWRMEPGWRGDSSYRTGGYREADRGGALRSGYRPGASGGWRQTRGGPARESAPRGPIAEADASGTIPGEQFAVPPAGGRSGGSPRGSTVRRRRDRRPRADRARRPGGARYAGPRSSASSSGSARGAIRRRRPSPPSRPTRGPGRSMRTSSTMTTTTRRSAARHRGG